MNREIFNRPALALVGGLTDTHETSPVLTRPLSDEHTVFFLPGNWNDKVESSQDKIDRMRAELQKIIAEHDGVDIVAVSAGGPLALCASHELEGTRGIITVASPLRVPEKMTLKLKLAANMFPALRGILETFVETVHPHLPSEKIRQLMNLRGTRDGKVPPAMSIVDGAVNHQVRTPPHIIASHSYNVRNALGLPVVKDFMAQTRAKPA